MAGIDDATGVGNGRLAVVEGDLTGLNRGHRPNLA
jgi:hypothetical protein